MPTPGDLPDPGIKCLSLASPALAGRFFTTEPPENIGTEVHWIKCQKLISHLIFTFIIKYDIICV